MHSLTIFTLDVLPLITDQFISQIISTHSLDTAYGLTDAVRDMASYATVFPHQLRQLY